MPPDVARALRLASTAMKAFWRLPRPILVKLAVDRGVKHSGLPIYDLVASLVKNIMSCTDEELKGILAQRGVVAPNPFPNGFDDEVLEATAEKEDLVEIKAPGAPSFPPSPSQYIDMQHRTHLHVVEYRSAFVKRHETVKWNRHVANNM